MYLTADSVPLFRPRNGAAELKRGRERDHLMPQQQVTLPSREPGRPGEASPGALVRSEPVHLFRPRSGAAELKPLRWRGCARRSTALPSRERGGRIEAPPDQPLDDGSGDLFRPGNGAAELKPRRHAADAHAVAGLFRPGNGAAELKHGRAGSDRHPEPALPSRERGGRIEASVAAARPAEYGPCSSVGNGAARVDR